MSKIVIRKIEDFIRQKKIFMTHIFPNTIHKARKKDACKSRTKLSNNIPLHNKICLPKHTKNLTKIGKIKAHFT